MPPPAARRRTREARTPVVALPARAAPAAVTAPTLLADRRRSFLGNRATEAMAWQLRTAAPDPRGDAGPPTPAPAPAAPSIPPLPPLTSVPDGIAPAADVVPPAPLADASEGDTARPADGGPDIRAWRTRMVGAMQAIPVPDLPSADTAPAAIGARGTALAGTRAPRRAAVPAEAEAAVSAPPEAAAPPPAPPPEPVPAATALVEAEADHRLVDAVLPDLAVSPRGTQALVRDPAAPPPPALSIAPEPTEPVSSEPAPEDGASIDAVCRAVEAPVPDLPPGTATGATIVDVTPPPRPPMPPVVGTIMRDVIARLLVDPGAQAAPILAEARNSAWQDGVLARVYPAIGAERLAGITAALTAALRLVASEAGVAAGELDAAVERRRVAAQAAAAAAAALVCSAGTDAAEALSSEGGAEVAQVTAAGDAQIAHATAVSEAAAGEGSTAAIGARRDAQLRAVNRRAGALRVGYEQALARRTAALDRALLLQNQAYDRAAAEDVAAIAAAAGDGLGLAELVEQGEARNWAAAAKRAAADAIGLARASAATETETFRTAVATAAMTASGLIRTWAAEQHGETESWWDAMWASYHDWAQVAEGEADAWATTRAEEARDATLGNLGVLDRFVAQAGETVDLDRDAAFAALSAEQQAVVRAFYAAPTGSRDALGAVAAGLRHRLAAEQQDALVAAMKAEVMAKPDSEAANLEQIGQAESAGFSATTIVDQLYEAMHGGVTGIGTDEDQIYRNLAGLTPLQGRAVRAMYAQDHGINLDDDLASELDEDNALIRARGALDGDVVVEAVGALNDAMHGGLTGAGTDEALVMRTLRGKTAEQRAAIVAEYRRRYGVDLAVDLGSEMDDHDLDRATALTEGDTARADAIALDQAMHGGILGTGTDEAQIEGVYADIRGDVVGEQVPDGRGGMRPMSQAEMEAEVARRNQDVEAAYDTRYGTPGDQESALRTAYRDELSGPELDLANALADNDLVAADAARLENERRGIYTDESAVNAILDNQYARALDAVRRDPANHARRQALDRRARAEGWDPYRLAAEQRTLDREMEQIARTGAAANMTALETRYDTRYSEWRGDGLRTLIATNLSGSDRARAATLVDQGYLTRAQQVDFATRGAGTDEEAFRRATAGLTAAEIVDLDRELALLGRPGVQAIADDELDGRDAFDMRMTLRGVPEDAEEEMAQAAARTDWEIANSPVRGHARDVMEARLATMRRQYALINDPDASPADRRRALDQFRARATGVSSSIESFRHQVDAVTDAVATTAALTTAIAVTVATGGLAGAVLGALYAAAVSMSIKSIMKGAAYGADEAAIDASIGLVDAAAAAATFGMGNALLRVATAGAGARVARLGGTRLAATLARMAASGSRAQRMLAHGIAEAIEGAAGALPSALAGNVLNDQNWEHGNPTLNIVGGTLAETGFGAALGGGLGSLGGISVPRTAAPVPPVSGDLPAHRGTPADRLAAWRAYRATDSAADMRTFLNRYDEQVRTALAAANADAAVQRAMRGELLRGIPAAERRGIAAARIEIVADADFRAFTRSDSAQAVTLIEGGRARILLREGAPLSVLREEGIHLHQLADPELGPIARRLDESRLRDWDSLSVADQLELYSAKLTLEIDAQARMIAGLSAELRALPDRAPGDAIGRAIGDAERSLATLRGRADQIAGFGRLDRIAMARGLRDPPPWLDQPARLFHKSAPRGEPPAIRAAEGAPRTKLDATTADSSPLQRRKDFGAGDTVHEVGARWSEPSTIDLIVGATVIHPVEGTLVYSGGAYVRPTTGEVVMLPKGTAITIDGRPATVATPRTVTVDQVYREVEWRAADGRVMDVRQEAMALSGARLEDLRWQQRGSGGVVKGTAAEIASRSLSEVRLQRGEIAGVLRVQQAGGTGFDGAEIRVDAAGMPHITLIEVKNYPGRYVPFEDFTAVVPNLQENLDTLLARLTPPTTLTAAMGYEAALIHHAGALGMAPETLRLGLDALDNGRLELEIRPAPGTRIGVSGRRPLIARIEERWRAMGPGLGLTGHPRPTVQPLDPALLREAEGALEAVRVSRQDGSIRPLREPIDLVGRPARFMDAEGRLLDIRRVGPGEITGPGRAALLDEIAHRLTQRTVLPSGFHVDLTLALDMGGLTPAQRTALLNAVQDRLRRTSGGRQALQRLIPMLTHG